MSWTLPNLPAAPNRGIQGRQLFSITTDAFLGAINAWGIALAAIKEPLEDMVNAVIDASAAASPIASVVDEIVAVAGITAQVTAVSGIAANVTTVAGIAANVTTLAGIHANVTSVAGIAGNVTTVAGIAAHVSAVGGIAGNVSTVAGIYAQVTTVAGVASAVSAVAGITASVSAVAAIDDEIVAVASIGAGVTALAAIDDDISAVAAISPSVVTLAAIDEDVSTVAGVAAGVSAVADVAASVPAVAAIAADVSAVAAIDDDIALCADNIADIQAAPDLAAALQAIAAGGNMFVTKAALTSAAGTIDANGWALVVVDESTSNHAVLYRKESDSMVAKLDLTAGAPPSFASITGAPGDNAALAAALGGKQPADANLPTWPAGVSATEVGHLDGVTSAIQTQLNSKLAASDGTATNLTIVGTITEDSHAIVDAAGFAIDPTNGSVQTIVLGANRTPVVANFAAGQFVLLSIDDGSARTITWSTIGVVWIGGSAPTLATSGRTWIVLWREGATYFGRHIGNTAS